MPIVTDDAPRAVATWLPRYRRAWLSADLVAGTTLAAFVVPESLAYAELAGLPPASGPVLLSLRGPGVRPARHLAHAGDRPDVGAVARRRGDARHPRRG
jgi:hypothetical protein